MAMNADGVTIRVKPDVLNARAQEVSSLVRQMERLFNEVHSTVERTRYYWIGEAGELHRKMFTEQKEDIEEILTRLKEHPTDLQKIAKVYTDTENSLTEAANQLSDNLID